MPPAMISSGGEVEGILHAGEPVRMVGPNRVVVYLSHVVHAASGHAAAVTGHADLLEDGSFPQLVLGWLKDRALLVGDVEVDGAGSP